MVHIFVGPIVLFCCLFLLSDLDRHVGVPEHMVMFFFIVRNCSFFMGIIFCSGVALVWTFNTRGVYDFITKEANILVNLVPFFNDIPFLFYRFLMSGVTNELKILFLWKRKNSKKIFLFQTGQNFAVHKALVWSIYVWRIATARNFVKKE